MSLQALQHLKRMRGGSQPHLLRASDQSLYVTKFQDNPQGTRILANDMLASRLGAWLGLPIPEVAVIEVSESLIDNTPDLCFELAGFRALCGVGCHFASRYICDLHVLDYLPEDVLGKVKNFSDFARVLVLDKWLGNCDGRQAVFHRESGARRFKASFIDQGYCFNATEWNFPDLPLHGVYSRNKVYEAVKGWEDFEPALTKAEQADPTAIWRCAELLPQEWYGSEISALERLVESIYKRRTLIRGLIADFRDSPRSPFPNWTGVTDYLPFAPQGTGQQSLIGRLA